ncbi:glycosyltransferase family 4 protein [Sabulibacter ruber]|uniref:glycosyltransferase family 4 protein n=1 Tax=Sabulibacter ruber TaxID=2811901 RepID=UPI001F60294A|nr:glycosyltransferase family 4 protein [Sabulibacter ruber]
MSIRVLFVVPYPLGKAPSQRFRFEQYFDILSTAGFTFQVAPFLDDSTWAILYKKGKSLFKAFGILKGFLLRVLLLFKIGRFDFVFIHREATPIGPPWFEWIVVKVFKKKVIYDFDDAIWIPNTSEANKIVAGIKWHHKVGQICKWAYKVSCGNVYLQSYAKEFNNNAYVIPTTIDTVGHHNKIKEQREEPVVIGWTGTHSTMKYLEPLVPVLQQLEEHYAFKFLVISNSNPELSLKSLVYLPWQKETEIEDLLKFNIGVMPLVNDPWSNGKCAFKALQYMALGIPAVVSPVGMNTEVVDDGLNGYVCATPQEWYSALETMLLDSRLRSEFGKAARNKIESCYAVTAIRNNFLGLFA